MGWSLCLVFSATAPTTSQPGHPVKNIEGLTGSLRSLPVPPWLAVESVRFTEGGIRDGGGEAKATGADHDANTFVP